MEPFTIHCSSCQSRIRVRNPNMIGQIANCPKCDSMIMIAPPQQILVDSGTGSPTDSVAVTKEALPMPDEGLLQSNPIFDQGFRDQRLHEPIAPALRAPELGALEPGALEPGTLESGALEGSGLGSISPSAWLPEPIAPPQAADERQLAHEEQANKSRQVMIVAAIGLCSVLLACSSFLVFLKWVGRPVTAARKPPAVTAPSQPAVTAPSQPGQPLEKVPDPTLAAAPPKISELANVPEKDSQPSIDPGVNDAAINRLGTDVGGPAVTTNNLKGPNGLGAPANGTASDVANNTSRDSVAGTSSAATDAQGVASSLPAASLASQVADIDSTFAPPVGNSDPQVIKETLPPGLQSFASIFDQGLVPVLSDATVPLGAAPATGDGAPTNDVTADATTTMPNAPMALALPEVVDQKQSLAISGLLIAKRPLPEVLATLSLTSEIPFTADLDSFAAAGMDRNLTINFKSTEPVSVAELLEKISVDSGVTFEPFQKKWIIARANSDKTKSRAAANWPIDDLVSNQEQSETLGKALEELLPELAGQIEFRDGAVHSKGDTLSPLLWLQVGRVLETWRGLRGIVNAQTREFFAEPSRLPVWPVEAAQTTAQKQISQVLLPEPLAQSWHRLSSEVGLVCWIDWPALEGAQLSPAKVSMVISNGRTYQDLIQYYANKYQVLFALEDQRTVWITTPDMHRFQPRLYVLPRGEKSIADWRTELAPLTPSSPIDGTGMLRVVPSPDGHFLFIRCCRPLLAEPKN